MLIMDCRVKSRGDSHVFSFLRVLQDKLLSHLDDRDTDATLSQEEEVSYSAYS